MTASQLIEFGFNKEVYMERCHRAVHRIYKAFIMEQPGAKVSNLGGPISTSYVLFPSSGVDPIEAPFPIA